MISILYRKIINIYRCFDSSWSIILIGIILFLVSAFLYFYSKDYYQTLFFIASGFFGLGLIIPISLKPAYLVWMSFAVILGWIMTRVILSSLFYLIITPIGIITRLLGEDFLELKTSNSDSYSKCRMSPQT